MLNAALASCQETKVPCGVEIDAVHEDGTPVPNAKVFARRTVGSTPNPNGGFPTDVNKMARTETDSAGRASLMYHASSGPEGQLWIRKDGYYPNYYPDLDWKAPAGGSPNAKWQASLKAVMKPIKNPIPMIFHRTCEVQLSEKSKSYGYDLEIGDAVAPLGKGKVADIEVVMDGTRTGSDLEKDQDIDFVASIRFPNPLDGCFEFPSQLMDGTKGSALLSDCMAPESGYQAQLQRKAVWGRARAGAAYWEYEHSLEKKGYYFRIRTKTDGSGNVNSCHYGKIYGPVTLLPGLKTRVNPPAVHEATLQLREVYFNPTSNDRNVECDTTVNLNKKLDEYGKPFQIDRP